MGSSWTTHKPVKERLLPSGTFHFQGDSFKRGTIQPNPWKYWIIEESTAIRIQGLGIGNTSPAKMSCLADNLPHRLLCSSYWGTTEQDWSPPNTGAALILSRNPYRGLRRNRDRCVSTKFLMNRGLWHSDPIVVRWTVWICNLYLTGKRLQSSHPLSASHGVFQGGHSAVFEKS